MPFEIPTGTPIEPGNYTAMLERVEVDPGGSFGSFRKWHWIVDVNGEATPMTALTSENTGPQSKSYQWLTALLGRTPQAGEKIEDPTGKRVVLTIEKNAKGFPTVVLVAPFSEPQQVLPGTPR